MYDVMNGVRVIEVAEHTFVPAAGMVLADWGADVIKVERAQGGDAARHMKLPGADGAINPFFEAANRGKRGIALDLTQPAGREQLYRLIDGADVFLTNLRADARQKLGIEAADLMARNPRLIYARGTGYGLRGALANDGGFDYPSAWCRAGAANGQALPGDMPPRQPGSIGDLTGGVTLAGAIAAALFRRERTGQGAVVDNALYMVGTYLMSQSLLATSIGAPTIPVQSQADSDFALANNYRTRDGRWISLCLLMDKWWPDFVAHVERPDLLEDSRFVDIRARHINSRALIAVLNDVFAGRDYADWCTRLASLEGVWAPVQNPTEVLADAQALENGFVSPVADRYMTGVSPAQFDERPVGELRMGPGFGQHTDEVLREIGIGESELMSLRKLGAVK
ncbi:CaiB/BaiF CoA-transferase family protein [Metapseudomonas resinovorans]|uniref:CaiB/BaiF CoA-transferase family protein n=1 Tax=Metapseudomonas resinovorans NBRC 106553 TaxID=1245471 RepID=S6ARL5_METRE|nr:CoA transferase [Pseudomonas resinovorans]BAN48553.1 CaiB/BaiF CoA-transferase family protein [Pseudomonas resinovorans NBRC 106553]